MTLVINVQKKYKWNFWGGRGGKASIWGATAPPPCPNVATCLQIIWVGLSWVGQTDTFFSRTYTITEVRSRLAASKLKAIEMVSWVIVTAILRLDCFVTVCRRHTSYYNRYTIWVGFVFSNLLRWNAKWAMSAAACVAATELSWHRHPLAANRQSLALTPIIAASKISHI